MKPVLWQRALRDAGLPSRAFTVGMALSTYCRMDGTGAHPGNTRLAAVTGLSIRSVGRALAELRDAKFIEPDDAQPAAQPVDNSGAGRPAVAWKLRDPDPN